MYYVVLKDSKKVYVECETLDVAFRNLDLLINRHQTMIKSIPKFFRDNIPTPEYDVIDFEGRSYLNV